MTRKLSVVLTLTAIAVMGMALPARALDWSATFETDQGYDLANKVLQDHTGVSPAWQGRQGWGIAAESSDTAAFVGQQGARCQPPAWEDNPNPYSDNYIIFNTDSSVANAKVWVEFYTCQLDTGPNDRWGYSKFALCDRDSREQQVGLVMHEYNGGHMMCVQVTDGEYSANSVGDYVPGQWYHFVMELNYATGKGKFYGKAVNAGDTAPLTCLDQRMVGEAPEFDFPRGTNPFAARLDLAAYGPLDTSVWESSVAALFDNIRFSDTRLLGPAQVPVQGTVTLENFIGSMAGQPVRVTFEPLAGGDNISRSGILDANGIFTVSDIMEDDYNVTISSNCFLTAKLTGVTIVGNPAPLPRVVLKGGDFSGSDQVGFDDFAILQNNYGDSGAAANPLAAAAATGGCGGLGITLFSFMGLAVCALRARNE